MRNYSISAVYGYFARRPQRILFGNAIEVGAAHKHIILPIGFVVAIVLFFLGYNPFISIGIVLGLVAVAICLRKMRISHIDRWLKRHPEETKEFPKVADDLPARIAFNRRMALLISQDAFDDSAFRNSITE